MKKLIGHIALVTGASRGLGAAIAKKLALEGAKVVVNYYNNEELANKVVEEIIGNGGEAIAIKADVTEEVEVKSLFAETFNQFGNIDIIVNNATGPQPFIKIEDLTWQSYLDQLIFFVKAPMLITQQALAYMKENRWGRIINIGSEVVELGNSEYSNYVAAKGAEMALTRSYANELGQFNITVNNIAPGWIPVERHEGTPQDAKDDYAKGTALKKQGVPEDIANAVAFLASEDAKFITGQRLSVNGGNTLV